MDINPLYLSNSFQNNFKASFVAGDTFVDESSKAVLRNYPFQVTTLPDFIAKEDLVDLVRTEIFDGLSSSTGLMVHRKNDLHDFYQAGDLGRNYEVLFGDKKSSHLKNLVDFFVKDPLKVKTLIENLTGCSLDPDRIDIAAQVYLPGSYLLCHDDALEGRMIAWVLYLIEPGIDSILGGIYQA